jgi:hypothetical protein
MNKVGTVNTGIYVDHNSFARSLSKAYNDLGTQVNGAVDRLYTGPRAPAFEGDERWTYSPSSGDYGTVLNPSSNGLDGTSIYSYAGSDYEGMNPIFLVYDEDNKSLVRPASICETFLNLWTYVNNQVFTAQSSNIVSPRGRSIREDVTDSEFSISPIDPGDTSRGTDIVLIDLDEIGEAAEVTMPCHTNLAVGYEQTIADKTGTAYTRNITINAYQGSSLLGGYSFPYVINNNGGSVTFKYVGNAQWIIKAGH